MYLVHLPIEQGAFLFGSYLGNEVVVEDVLHDSTSKSHCASYMVSNGSNYRINQYQNDSNLNFLGVIHSHPESMIEPSGTDRASYKEMMQRHETFEYILAPIVCKVKHRAQLKENQLELENQFVLNVYIQTKEKFCTGIPVLTDESYDESMVDSNEGYNITLQDISSDCSKISSKYHWNVNLQSGEIDNVTVIVAYFEIDTKLKIKIFFTFAYPVAAPLIAGFYVDSPVNFPPLEWDLSIDRKERLEVSLNKLVRCCTTTTQQSYSSSSSSSSSSSNSSSSSSSNSSSKQYTIMYGKSIDTAFYHTKLDSDWKPFICEHNRGSTLSTSSLKFERVKEITSPIENAPILIFGCGSVGSAVTEYLVRAGCTNITIVDIDTVTEPNISRATYTISDVGKKKTIALLDKMKAINPSISMITLDDDINNSPDIFINLIEEKKFQMIVAATDDPFTQERIGKISYLSNIPTVAPGVYDKAKGGEVIISIPSKSYPCYNCLIKRNYNTSSEVRPMSKNYNLDKLEAVVALGSDISFVSSLASKVIISLLLYQKLPIEPNHTADVSRLWIFGKDIVTEAKSFCKMSFYSDYQNLISKEIDMPSNLDHHFYGHVCVWYDAEQMDWIPKQRTCDVCSNIGRKIPIHKVIWSKKNDNYTSSVANKRKFSSLLG